MQLFDAHSHLQLSQFDADRAEVLERMQQGGVGSIVIGVDLATSRGAVELAAGYEFLWAAVGLHPNDSPKEEFDIAAFEELAKHPKVVAIGECGLDYFRSGGTPEEQSAQKARFEKQIELAIKVGKPLIIHCRNAHDDMLEILFSYSQEFKNEKLRAVIHFCTVSGELAQKYLDLGCYLSFPGPITYTDMYDDSIKVAPLERILAETDSPFAAPVPHRGQRNEPAYVEGVVKKIALIKNVSAGEMATQIVKNSQKLFDIAG
ncbi:MAG TPA: TatD family hydrolase [Candidatus Paceibacterota bacterium]|nr:TatD family hydrolase [Candidatus Paceibacterota bacterium]